MMMSYIQSEYQKQEVYKLSEKMMKLEECLRYDQIWQTDWLTTQACREVIFELIRTSSW